MFKLRHPHDGPDEDLPNAKLLRTSCNVPLKPPSFLYTSAMEPAARIVPRPLSPLRLDTFHASTTPTRTMGSDTRPCGRVRPFSNSTAALLASVFRDVSCFYNTNLCNWLRVS